LAKQFWLKVVTEKAQTLHMKNVKNLNEIT